VGEYSQLALGQQYLAAAKQLLIEVAKTALTKFITKTFMVTFLAGVVGFGGNALLLFYRADIEPVLQSEQFNMLRSIFLCLPGIGIANYSMQWVGTRISHLKICDLWMSIVFDP
jgi:hypothetical protein